MKKKKKLYVVECNPRLLGSFPTLTMAEIENGEPPIIAFHLLEYLGIPYKINIEKINNLLWQKKEGAHIFLHSSFGKEAMQQGELEAGIYRLKIPNLKSQIPNKSKIQNQKAKIQFLRSGYKFSHLKKKNEFLLTDGIQKKGVEFQPYRRLTRILTKKRVLDKSLKDITPEMKKIAELVRRELKLKEK